MNTGHLTDSKKRTASVGKGRASFVLLCFLASCVISAAIIAAAVEIFALPSELAELPSVTLELDADADTAEVAKLLKENGLIKSSLLFRVYTLIRGNSREFKAGRYSFSPSSGYDGHLRELRGGERTRRTQVSVTIPEGSDVEDIIRIVCDEAHICSEQEMLDVIQNGSFDEYYFVRELDASNNSSKRKYRLEGYLYPDTYYFYSDSSAHTVIDRMLSNFNTRFDERYRAACKKNGLSTDQAVTLASMIMKEAKFVSDYPKVSSVFHNRMNSALFGGKLQSDATLTYALGRAMRAEDKTLDSLYNTYVYAGYPPSPICAPDLNALSCALCPDKTGYYYFVSDANGRLYYASTYAAHQKNVKKASG